MVSQQQGINSTPPHPAASTLQCLLTVANETEREVALRLGLNLTDYRALSSLSQSGPRTAGTLAADLGATAATTTAIINRLEAHGYVARIHSATDRRQVNVAVTPAADMAIQDLLRPLVTATSHHLDGLPQDHQAAIADFLNVAVHLMQDHLNILAEKESHD